MTKYELIQSIKNEIKATSAILKENKKNFKFNQRLYSKAKITESDNGVTIDLGDDCKKIECYPFSKPWNGAEEINSKKYFKGNFWNFNPDAETAKCHLTCLHIVYNILRNKKQHCHNEERNKYYVQYHKAYFEGVLNQYTEEQDAHVSCPSTP